jgi:hypothetical protein
MRLLHLLCASLVGLGAPVALSAQVGVGGAAALLRVGGQQEDLLRLEQLLGIRGTEGWLIRTPRLVGMEAGSSDLSIRAVLPHLRYVHNSALPHSWNEGALWAGRGSNALLSAGGAVIWRGLTLIATPELAFSANQSFEILPEQLYERHAGLSTFSYLWLRSTHSIDLPYRFGDRASTTLHPGQSRFSWTGGGIELGLSSENQWWGPGVRGAILISNNAAGVPHAFLATSRPWRTPLGNLEARWLLGRLAESPHFDQTPGNDHRSLSGAVFTLRPHLDPNLTIGAARVVYAPVGSGTELASRSFDAFFRWERRSALWDSAWAPSAEQLFSIFGRYVFPASGFEAYAEWARYELPLSLTDLALAPNHSHGYTLGLQWARRFALGTARLQGEHTNLEMSSTFNYRPVGTFYMSRSVPQGYTHRGQVVGAAMGPGSSGQWIAGDLLRESWRVGLTAARVRWDAEALYATRSPNPWRDLRSFHAHDVSTLVGVRGGVRTRPLDLDAELVRERRFNYLFQNPDIGFGPEGAVDVTNWIVRISLTPSARIP